MKPRILIIVLCATLAVVGVTQATPVDKPEKSMALRKIMQERDHNTQAATDAITREDWALLAELASMIALPPAPPLSEKMRTLSWLGTDVGKFRGFDKKTREAAHAMGMAAECGDGKAVIQSFARIQDSCLACHQAFRKPFTEHFYTQH
ncbi:MAG: cytochrome C [Desulfuromonadaceae bacterium]|nr:cytochrome C [Desulfuromonadaceae bacterium]